MFFVDQVVIPLDLGIRINENDPVRKLIEICDELDYTDLYAAYLRHWRKIDPRTMFELLVFAYMNGIYSSRDIESACRHDIRFMWILQNEPVPDHSTIARFQNERLTGVMEELFYQLTEKLMVACGSMTIDEILALPDVQERVEIYKEQTEKFKEMVTAHTRVEGNVIISDLRGVDPIYTGNRFMIYSMYPEQNISAWIVNGKGGKGCSAAVGYSILNRTSNVDVGKLMLKYGGGGHKAVGTCQFTDENMDTELPKMLDELING